MLTISYQVILTGFLQIIKKPIVDKQPKTNPIQIKEYFQKDLDSVSLEKLL